MMSEGTYVQAYYVSPEYVNKLRDRITELEAERDENIPNLLDRIEELEAQGAVDRATCRWCGTIHARKMNSLCPLTIAESKLATIITELREMARGWQHEPHDSGVDNCADELTALLEKHSQSG